MTAPLKIGVIGFGYRGPQLVQALSAFTGSHVVAVAELDSQRRDAVKVEFPWVDTTADFRTLLADDDIEAIAIATPLLSHYPLAKAALTAGKHVLVESPVADTSDAANELLELAERRKRTLMVANNFLFTGAVKRIRELLDDGRLGRMLCFDSVRVDLGILHRDHNVLWELAAHDLAILDYLIKTEPEWISASGAAHYDDLEDLAYVTIGYEDELLAHIHCNWVAPVQVRRMTLTGTDRMLVYDDTTPTDTMKIYESGVDVDQLDLAARHHLNGQYRTGDVSSPKLDTTAPLHRMVAEFCHACVEGKAPITDGIAGLRVVQMLEAAQESMEQDGERIEL